MPVARHTFYNVVGLSAPIAAALVAIPFLIEGLGVERFAVLTLIWAIVNYFGIFDFGLGRALTMQIAVELALKRPANVNHIIVSGITMLLVLGCLSGVAAYWLFPVLWGHLDVSLAVEEVQGTLVAVAVAIPFIVLTAGLRGVLEARHAFGVINLIRTPLGVLNFLGPMVVVTHFAGGLDDIAWLLTYARTAAFFVFLFFMWKLEERWLSCGRFDWNWTIALLRSGGWMTVTNIISPLMSYLDRFVVGTLLPASLLAYYSTPQELVLRAFVLPGALTAVLFPRFAAEHAGKTKNGLYVKSLVAMLVTMLVGCSVSAYFAYNILALWISADFAQAAYRVLQILLVGMFVGALAAIPFTYLQAIGQSKAVAVSHMFQLPLFLMTSYFFTQWWGIEGAALAWSVRLLVDACVLFLLVCLRRLFSPELPQAEAAL